MPADYVNKLARMFQDIKVSEDLNQVFKEMHKHNKLALPGEKHTHTKKQSNENPPPLLLGPSLPPLLLCGSSGQCEHQDPERGGVVPQQ